MVFKNLQTDWFEEAATSLLRQTKICEDRGYHRTIINESRPLEERAIVPLCYECMDDLIEDNSNYRIVPIIEIDD